MLLYTKTRLRSTAISVTQRVHYTPYGTIYYYVEVFPQSCLLRRNVRTRGPLLPLQKLPPRPVDAVLRHAVVDVQLAFGIPLDKVVAHLARPPILLPEADVAAPVRLVYLDGMLLLPSQPDMDQF